MFCILHNIYFHHYLIYFNLIFSGVTDSKAVTGSKSTLDITPSTNSLVVIITGVSTGIVFTILVVCLFVTCRRKVSFEIMKCNYWMTRSETSVEIYVLLIIKTKPKSKNHRAVFLSFFCIMVKDDSILRILGLDICTAKLLQAWNLSLLLSKIFGSVYKCLSTKR